MNNNNEANIKNAIENQIQADDIITADNEIYVEVSSDTAILKGSVLNNRIMRRAEADAYKINGIRRVENQLKVVNAYSNPSVQSDTSIIENINKVLESDPDINVTNITIDGTNGKFILRGVVDQYWKKYEAEGIAFGVEGVVSIINMLGIVPTNNINDVDLANDIEEALYSRNNLDVDKIDVTVDDGKVTLEGTVPDWYAMEVANNIVLDVKGVLNLENNLAIGSMT